MPDELFEDVKQAVDAYGREVMRRELGQASHRLRDPLSLSLGAVRDAERAENGRICGLPGRKARKCCCCFQSPSPDRFAVEIPEKEERRAGVNASLRLWIILDEYNQDVYRPIASILSRSRGSAVGARLFSASHEGFIVRRAGTRGVNRRPR